MYSLQCTVYSVKCALYIVLCTMYSVQCTLYTVKGTLYTSVGTMDTNRFLFQGNLKRDDNNSRLDLRLYEAVSANGSVSCSHDNFPPELNNNCHAKKGFLFMCYLP